MTEPVTSHSPLTCPMCGKPISAADTSCHACGEALGETGDVTRDRNLCFLTATVTLLITVGMLANCVYLHLEVVRQNDNRIPLHIAVLNRDVMVMLTLFVSAWLWGPPVIRVEMFDPKKVENKQVISRWRIFWQTQATMYALSIAFVLLCLVTCATR